MQSLKTFVVLTLLPFFSTAQVPIALENPSFTGEPRTSMAPNGWVSCNPKDETPSDIQPGYFGCTRSAAEGNTYVGMVVRDNYTWESLAQRLSAPLDSGVCYAFSVQLAASPEYISGSRLTGQTVNYNTPAVFRVWGGYDACDAQVLLAESIPIGHYAWKKYGFVVRHLEPRPLTHLIIQAYYAPGQRCQPVNGNLLIDDLSPITPAVCPTLTTDTLRDARVFVPELSDLKTEIDLDAILKTRLANVRYQNRGEPAFIFDCLENHEGMAVLFSRDLLTVAAALSRFPDKKLILRTKNARASNRNTRAEYLKNYLLDAGLPKAQLDIMPEQMEEHQTWKLETQWLNANW